MEQFADLLSKVAIQLQRLEDAWKDRWWEILVENNMKESDIPNYPTPLKGLWINGAKMPRKVIECDRKLAKITAYLTNCKESLAAIIVQMIT